MPLKNFIQFQLKMWSLSPLVWLVLAVFLLSTGVFLNIFYFSFTALENSGDANELVASFFGTTVILYFLLSPILLALQRQGGFGRHHEMLSQFALSPFKLLLSQYLSALVLMSLFFIISLCMSLCLLIWMEMDFGIYLSSSIGALLILNVIVALTITIGSLCKNQVQTLGVTLIVFLGLYLVELLSQHQWTVIASIASSLSLLAPFKLFGEGVLPLEQLTRLVALTVLFLSVVLTINNYRAKRRILKPVLCTCASLLVIISSSLWQGEIQLAKGDSQRLSIKVQETLKTLDKPLGITAYTSSTETRLAIESELSQVLRSNPKINLTFGQAVLQPDAKAAYEMSTLVTFRYGDNSQTLHFPFASHFTDVNSTLLRLVHGKSIIVFSEGNGERSPFGDSTRDLKLFTTRLTEDGYLIQALSLDDVVSVPANASTLVVASPKTALSSKNIEKIWAFVEAGGSLLWINDPDSPALPSLIQEKLGIKQNTGVVVDPSGLSRGSPHAAITLIDQFEAHPLTQPLKQLAALPLTSSFNLTGSDWRQKVLLQSKNSAWLDSSENLSESTKNPNGKKGKVHSLVVAFDRPDQSQRIVLAGGGHFLSDATVHNYGNLDLSAHLVYWLSHQDDRLGQITAPSTAKIQPTKTLNFLMVYFFPWLLPFSVLLLAAIFFTYRYRSITI